eukprot:TRINITY_DN39173_c0_g1_i1.p1 TRINITY_DN39173_c0_g1~~TRINITY_DN39173_c0_g1_i1.p1  ORF type:complete len:656 (+),score=204.20 TRINITY_DN39173_c0_g1_i1:51-1970(+)
MHAAALLPLVHAATYQPAPVATASGAYANCSCVDTSAAPWAGHLAAHVVVLGSEQRLSGPSSTTRVRTYGSQSCAAWDVAVGSVHPSCVGASAPKWCSAEWCYVDSSNCGRGNNPSTTYQGLFYSYETCGNINNYIDDSVDVSALLGRPLRVWAAGGDAFVSNSNMRQPGRSLIAFAGKVLEKVGITSQRAEHQDLSAASLQLYGNSSNYTACVHDIAIGNLDLCAGDFWDTDERRAMRVGFSGTVVSEEIYLLTGETSGESAWDKLSKTFKPFSGGLWGLIVGVVFLSALVMAGFEHRRNNEDFHYERYGKFHQSLVKSAYLSLQSFVAAGLYFSPRTASGRLYSLGYGFFLLVVVASFTGSTANFLIQNSQKSGVQDVAGAVNAGMRICYAGGMEQTLLELFPQITARGVNVGDESGLEAVDAGRCEAVLTSQWVLTDKHAAGNDCNKTLVGRPVVSFPTGYYVSASLAAELGWAVATKRLDGSGARVVQELTPESGCPKTEDDADSVQLEVVHMAGACLFLGVCLVCGVLIRVAETVAKRSRHTHRQAEDSGADMDSPVSPSEPAGGIDVGWELQHLRTDVHLIRQLLCPDPPRRSSKASRQTSSRLDQMLESKLDREMSEQGSQLVPDDAGDAQK